MLLATPCKYYNDSIVHVRIDIGESKEFWSWLTLQVHKNYLNKMFPMQSVFCDSLKIYIKWPYPTLNAHRNRKPDLPRWPSVLALWLHTVRRFGSYPFDLFKKIYMFKTKHLFQIVLKANSILFISSSEFCFTFERSKRHSPSDFGAAHHANFGAARHALWCSPSCQLWHSTSCTLAQPIVQTWAHPIMQTMA